MKSEALSNGALKVKFEDFQYRLRLLSKALPSSDISDETPEQFMLWTMISELQDLQSLYKRLQDVDDSNM